MIHHLSPHHLTDSPLYVCNEIKNQEQLLDKRFYVFLSTFWLPSRYKLIKFKFSVYDHVYRITWDLEEHFHKKYAWYWRLLPISPPSLCFIPYSPSCQEYAWNWWLLICFFSITMLCITITKLSLMLLLSQPGHWTPCIFTLPPQNLRTHFYTFSVLISCSLYTSFRCRWIFGGFLHCAVWKQITA